MVCCQAQLEPPEEPRFVLSSTAYKGDLHSLFFICLLIFLLNYSCLTFLSFDWIFLLEWKIRFTEKTRDKDFHSLVHSLNGPQQLLLCRSEARMQGPKPLGLPPLLSWAKEGSWMGSGAGGHKLASIWHCGPFKSSLKMLSQAPFHWSYRRLSPSFSLPYYQHFMYLLIPFHKSLASSKHVCQIFFPAFMTLSYFRNYLTAPLYQWL